MLREKCSQKIGIVEGKFVEALKKSAIDRNASAKLSLTKV